MKIQTNVHIKELDNTEAALTIGKALANIILLSKNDPLRSYLMAQKLYSNESVELTKADFEWIKKTVTDHGCEFYQNALVSGQLLIALSDSKE